MSALRDHLAARRAAGRKLLVPYVMAGVPDPGRFGDVLDAVARGADAVEVGVPYSDPVMDGPVIASAGEAALRAGVRPRAALDLARAAPGAPPRVVMTYYNPVHRAGESAFCRAAAARGVAGLIVPDLPVEESALLRSAAAAHGIAWVPLVAPTSSPARVEAITATATGFVYAVSTLGVTGERAALSERAAAVVAACRRVTDLPVVVGIGVSTPAHAVEAARTADGVVIGSAIVRLVREGGAAAAGRFVDAVRAALDDAYAPPAGTRPSP